VYPVGSFNHLEKYEFVIGKDDIPYIMENKKCSKPPIRYINGRFLLGGHRTEPAVIKK
jgi:hypothetical protein